MKLRRQRTPAYFKLPVQADPRSPKGWMYGEEEPDTDETPEEELKRLTEKSPNGWERGVNETPKRRVDIVKHYVEERKNVTEKTLTRFIRRWRAIWEMQYQLSHLDTPMPVFHMRKETHLLLSGKFSRKKLWKAFQRMFFGETPPKTVYDRAALELHVPTVLLQTTILAGHFGVPATLAQVRLCVHSFPGYEGWGF